MDFCQTSLFAIGVAGRAALVYMAVGMMMVGIPALAFTTDDAGTIFNSYTKAFYSLDGTNGYFKGDQVGGVADFWMQAEEIECVIDACEWNSNASRQVMIVNLLNGFEKQNGTNWSSNIYNDDCMWASIAFARGYLVSGNPRFRDIARWNFDMVFARALDTNHGGGLYWTTTNQSKNACVNGPGGIAAHLLYQIYGDASYLTKASNIFNWERSILFNPNTGTVADAIDLNGRIHSWTSSYNQGTFIGLSNFLGQTNDAMLAANYTKDHLTDSGILPQYGIAGNNSGFNAIFFRWMSRFMRDRGLQSIYQPWLQDNANAAWNVRRTSDGLSWCQWQQQTPTGTNLHSWDCIASLEAMQVVSPTPNTSSGTAAPMAGAHEMKICRVEVVEKGSGWSVPLIELRTTHLQRFVTDNAGVIALDSPELMGRETWFDVIGHSYEIPKDDFGYRGVQLKPEPGKTFRVEVTRTSIARCLGRATGGGLFAESQKLGGELDWTESGVLGCDTVQTAVHRGKMFWFWGDTTLANYPLGIFHCSGATSEIQPLATFEPPLRMPFNYFTDGKGNPRGTAQMAGDGPTWISGCVSAPDSNGAPRLVCTYAKIRGFLEPYQTGLCVWNDAAEKFEPLRVLWNKSAATPKPPPSPNGHTVFWKDENGKEWVLFGNPLPTLRCPATFEAWQDSSTWEMLVPQKNFISALDGKPVVPHAGSIAWNPWRRRWITVFVENHGQPSILGEVWYAEAAAPTGPWGKAVKILTHENYTFYNPCLHPEFTASNSPVVIFEGTYSQTFADHPQPTPRYDYNQMVYRLDLDDARLRPAQQP